MYLEILLIPQNLYHISYNFKASLLHQQLVCAHLNDFFFFHFSLVDQETTLPRSENMESFSHNDQNLPDPTQAEDENGNNHDNSEIINNINNNVDTNQLVDQVIPCL